MQTLNMNGSICLTCKRQTRLFPKIIFTIKKKVREGTFCIRPKIIQTDEVMHSFASLLLKQYSLRFLSGLKGDFIG